MARGSHIRGRGSGGGSGRGSGGDSSRGSGGVSGRGLGGGSGRDSGGGSGHGSGGGSDRGAIGRASDASSAATASRGQRFTDLVRDDSSTRSRSPTPLDASRSDGGPSTEKSPPIAARRGMCYIEGDKLVCDEDAKTTRVSSCITEILKSRLVKEGTEWKTIPHEIIDIYFEEFKKWYWWREDDAIIKRIFIRHAGRRYSDLLCNMKRALKVGKPMPTGVAKDVWETYKAFWNKEETIQKANKMHNNRMSEVGGVGTGPIKHVGGSCSSRGHAKALEKELGRPPTLYEVMCKTHIRKDGSFVNEKSRKIVEEVEAHKRVAEEHNETMDYDSIFIDVVGIKKKRLFGTGSYGTSIASMSSTGSLYSSQHENETLRIQVETLTSELQAEREERAKFEQAEQEKRTKFEEEMNKRFLLMAEELSAFRSQPPSS